LRSNRKLLTEDYSPLVPLEANVIKTGADGYFNNNNKNNNNNNNNNSNKNIDNNKNKNIDNNKLLFFHKLSVKNMFMDEIGLSFLILMSFLTSYEYYIIKIAVSRW
jgi:hypothetical protein